MRADIKVIRDGPTIELEVTKDCRVTFYCRNEAHGADLLAMIGKSALGMDAQVKLSSGLILNFDNDSGLVLEDSEVEDHDVQGG